MKSFAGPRKQKIEQKRRVRVGGSTSSVPAVALSSPSSSSAQSPPNWFTWAITEPFESFRVTVDDKDGIDGKPVSLHCLRWGASKVKRPLIFIHGGAAHCYWFSFIAPFFSDNFDVIAISNSGNGESDSRSQKYSIEIWAEEILICLEKLNVFTPDRPRPYLVAHSLGTYVITQLLRFIPGAIEKFGGVILVDGAIREYETAKAVHERVIALTQSKFRDGWRINSSKVSPRERFILRPFQECENEYILKYLAERGRKIVDDEGAWIWNGDYNRDAKFSWAGTCIFSDQDVSIIAKSIPVAFMYGEESLLCDVSVAEFVQKKLGSQIGVLGVPCAGHHVWLDAPLPFITALRGVFAGWPSENRKADDELEEEALKREAILESKL